MKKQFLLKSMLLLCMLFVGMGAWADEVTWTASSGALGSAISNLNGTATGTIKTGSYDWSYTRTLKNLASGKSDYIAMTGSYLQIGSSNAGENVEFTTSNIPGTINSIVVNCASAGHTVTATVGSTSYSCSAVPAWSSNQGGDLTISSTNPTNGKITITFNVGSNKKPLYIKSITVNYTSGGGSTPTTYNVNIANNIANGNVTANPTSAASGSEVTLTATPNTGYEFCSWNVTNASTSAAITVTNNKFTMPAADVNVSATFNAVPTHNARFFVNGQQYGETQSVAEGAAVTFPANKPADIDDKKFVGWADATIGGTTNTAPTFVTSATMGTNDKYFYAVFATASGIGEQNWTITSSDLSENDPSNSSGYGKYKGDQTKDGYTVNITDMYPGTSTNAGKMQFKSSSGVMYNKTSFGKITKIEIVGGGMNVYQGSSQITSATGLTAITKESTPASPSTYLFSTSNNNGYFLIKNGSSTSYITSIKVYYDVATYSDYCTSVSTKTLSSIAVKTAPTKVTYTEDELFDPTGLVITATYDDESAEDIAYASNTSAFTFSPSLTTALTTSDRNVTITYKEKNTTQAITVNAIPTYTLTITQPAEGGVLTVKDGETVLENDANVRVGTNLTCEVTGIPEGKRFSRFYAKWGEEDSQSKYKATNPATFDNIATENITECEIYVTYKDIQYYTINYMINGVNTDPQENLEEKTVLTFPTAPATIGGKYFIGWSESEISGTVNEEPTLVNTSEETATANKTYYAVYATKGEGGEATYTKATTLAIGDKVVFGLGEVNGKPEQAVTGASSGATISATENEWIVYTATTYTGKDGIVLQMENGNYQRAASGKFEFTSDNPATFTTNASSHIIGYTFTLYNTPSNGNKFYSSKGDGYVEFLMWKVEGGVSFSDFCTTIATSQAITTNENSVGSYVAVDALDFTRVDGLEAFVATAVTTNTITLAKVNKVPARTAFVVKGAQATATYNVPFTTATEILDKNGNVTTNIFLASDGTYTVEEGDFVYALAKTGSFKQVADGVTIPAGKAYIKSNVELSKALTLDFDEEVSSINGIENVNYENNAAYNLAGQRVNANAKGIIIVNGKKVLNK